MRESMMDSVLKLKACEAVLEETKRQLRMAQHERDDRLKALVQEAILDSGFIQKVAEAAMNTPISKPVSPSIWFAGKE